MSSLSYTCPNEQLRAANLLEEYHGLLANHHLKNIENTDKTNQKNTPPDEKIQKKIIVHLDINLTIFIKETQVSQSLAKSLWDRWQDLQGNECDLKPFSIFVYEDLHPGDFRNEEKNRIRKAAVNSFTTFLKQEGFEYADLANEIELAAKSMVQDASFVDSFFNLIEYLERTCENGYTIQLQSFGDDMDAVTKALDQRDITHLQFEKYLFNGKRQVFINDRTKQELSPSSFHEECMKTSNAVQCDWGYWHEHGEIHEAGKVIPICNTDDVLSIVFDDNVFRDYHKQGCISPISPDGDSLCREQCIKNGLVVQVDPLLALFDPNFFTNHLLAALNQEETVSN